MPLYTYLGLLLTSHFLVWVPMQALDVMMPTTSGYTLLCLTYHVISLVRKRNEKSYTAIKGW